jgi:glycosyltransferase involved in cell wall biosynthesis
MLADDESAIYVAPESEEKVIADIALAMDRLAGDADFAESVSRSARRIAEADFTWEAASESWERAYRRCRDSTGRSGRSGWPDISWASPGSRDPSV